MVIYARRAITFATWGAFFQPDEKHKFEKQIQGPRTNGLKYTSEGRNYCTTATITTAHLRLGAFDLLVTHVLAYSNHVLHHEPGQLLQMVG